MTACQNCYYMVSSATETISWWAKETLQGRNLTSFNIDVTNWEVCAQYRPLVAQNDSYRSKNSRNKQDRGGSEKARCSQSETLLYH